MKYLPVLLSLLICFQVAAQKKALSIEDADQWKHLENVQISNHGRWVAYRIEPQVGDAHLVFHNTKDLTSDTLKRVSKYQILQSKPYLVATVKPAYDNIRALKLKKEKKENFPKDSLFVVNLKTGEKEFIDLISTWSIADGKGGLIAYLQEEPLPVIEEEPADTSKSEEEEKPKKAEPKKDKDSKPSLVIYDISSKEKTIFPEVTKHSLSYSANYCIFHSRGDSTFESGAYIWNSTTKQAEPLDIELKGIDKIATDTFENQFALLSTLQETKDKEKFYALHHFNFGQLSPEKSLDSNDLRLRSDVSNNAPFYYTKDGRRLFFGIYQKRAKHKEDSTLLDTEKPKLDVWSHHDDRLQPQQLKELDKEKKAYIPVFMDTKKGSIEILAEDVGLRTIVARDGQGDYAYTVDPTPYYQEKSWAYPWRSDVYLLNLKKGGKELFLEGFRGRVGISPAGKYMYWFDQEAGSWWLMDLKKKKKTRLDTDMPGVFVNAEDDHPMLPGSYGIGGWLEEDEYFLVNDRFGVWLFDPTGKKPPFRIGEDENSTRRIRVVKKNRDRFIEKGEGLSFTGFDTKTKSSVSAFYNWAHPGLVFQEPTGNEAFKSFYMRSRDSKVSLYRTSSSTEYPELYLSGKQLSITNPQQKKYKWYETELVNYLNSDGIELQGILYKPENYDPNKKYPMIVYFYERMSDYINSYQEPRPSASTISRSFYCSNDYFVFVPDIVYKDGQPGQSAFNCIIPGVLKLLNERPYLDKDRMALQGQSWGGYQTAFLVTKTDLFACGMAGAPVSNMTSAYGGIRWGSGLNRAFQYERGQSRIGGDLWSYRRDYIDNSPLFYADRVNTPLLIMHNDNDGAVPWYQGIEYFTALRRLDKEVWMLVYNGEEHNLKDRANRVDLSHRMFGFFNYYLKGEEMPLWMKEGIPAIDKGKVLGY